MNKKIYKTVGAGPVSAHTSKDRQNKGITLIALIITIIVMLILVSVTISMAINGGLFEKAGEAVGKTENAINKEQELANGKITIGGVTYNSIDEYIQSQDGFKGIEKGKYIVVNDVNPKQHDLKVTLTSDTIDDFSSVSVSRYGSNLLDITQMLDEDLVDNGNGTFTFTRTSDQYDSRFSGEAEVYIPAGIPFDISLNKIDSTLSHHFYVELTFENGDKEYPNYNVDFTTYDKNITKIRFFVNNSMVNVGEYIIFSEPKINIGYSCPYEEYVEPQTVTANKNGVVEGLTSLSPSMTLITNNKDVVINCEYKEKIREYSLYGKTIVNFGDSIFGNYNEPEDISTFLTDYTGATVYNVGFGGTRMGVHNEHWNTLSMYSLANAITSGNFELQENAVATNTEGTNRFPDYFSNTLSRLKNIDFNKVDIITIAYGTNDFTGGLSIDNETNNKDTSTFAGALRYSIETIKQKYPNIQIVLCSPMYRFWMDENNNFLYDSGTYERNAGGKLTDFVQAEKELGNEYNLLVIDNYYELGIDATNRTKYFSATDGTHPNAEGRKLIAEHIAKEIYENLNK